MHFTNILKRLLVLIISLITFHTTLFTQANLSKLFDSTLPSVVKIQTFNEDNSQLMSGTGFFISPDGKGISNSHVFNNAFKSQITNSRGEIYAIDSLWFRSDSLDLVMFKVNYPKNETLSFLNIAENTPEIGEETFTIGNPIGLDFTVSKGIISSIRNHPTFGQIIQTDAPISAGNSGSPLLNMNGMVVGVITYTYKEGQNLNFALSLIKRSLSEGFLKTSLPRSHEPQNSLSNEISDDYALVQRYHSLGIISWQFYIDFQKNMIGGPEWLIYINKSNKHIPIESYVTGAFEEINGNDQNVVYTTMAVVKVDKNLTYVISYGAKINRPYVNTANTCRLMLTRITDAEPTLLFDEIVEKTKIESSDNRFLEATGNSLVSMVIEDQMLVRAIKIDDHVAGIFFNGDIFNLKTYKITESKD